MNEIKYTARNLADDNVCRHLTKVLFLSVNSGLHSPVPKIYPLLISALRGLGCQITTSPWGRHSDDETYVQKIFGRLGDIQNIVLEVIRTRPDILFVQTAHDKYTLARDIPLLFITSLFPAKKVLLIHGSSSGNLVTPGHALLKVFTRILIRFCDSILLLSSEELREWQKFCPSGRYYRVDNPLDLDGVQQQSSSMIVEPEKNGKPVLLFVGRLMKTKGIFDLLQAMPEILAQRDCHLMIAGEGDQEEEIANQIERDHLGQSVTLLGYLDSEKLTQVYRSSSMLVLPTYHNEGFATVIAEAMSFGLPIISTPWRGTLDHLEDELNGLFVKPKDPKAITYAVVRLLSNPTLRIEMSRANQLKAQEFLPEKVAVRYMEIFDEILRIG